MAAMDDAFWEELEAGALTPVPPELPTPTHFTTCVTGCGRPVMYQVPRSGKYCEQCAPINSRRIYNLCTGGCGQRGYFVALDRRVYCAHCKPVDALPISGGCLRNCGRIGSFVTDTGDRYCVQCRPAEAIFPCATEGCTRRGDRVALHRQYCAVCVPPTSNQYNRCSTHGCGQKPTFCSLRGQLYCTVCKPPDSISMSRRCVGCGNTASHRRLGRGYCRQCKPLGSRPVSRACSGVCGRSGNYLGPDGKRWCRDCRPPEAVTRCSCGCPAYTTGPDGVVRCRRCAFLHA